MPPLVVVVAVACAAIGTGQFLYTLGRVVEGRRWVRAVVAAWPWEAR